MFTENKSAFGGVASTLIMFIAIVGLSTGLVVSFQNYVAETQDSFAYQNDLTVSKLKTSLSITLIDYNTTSQTIYVYVKNVGESKLRPTNFDLFIDDAFYTNFSAYQADNLSAQMTVFSPQETLAIVMNISLGSGSHDVRVATELGVTVEDSFNI